MPQAPGLEGGGALVTVRLPRQLRRYASDSEFIEAEGATVLEVLQTAAAAHPDLLIRLFSPGDRVHPHLAIFHEAQLVHHDDLSSMSVDRGDRLDVLISVAGGGEPEAPGSGGGASTALHEPGCGGSLV